MRFNGRGKFMQKSTTNFFSLFCIAISTSIMCSDPSTKHSEASAAATATVTPSFIVTRHDELLKATIDLGRDLANPDNISFNAWAESLGKDISLVTTASSVGFYSASNYSFLNQVLLSAATTIGITIGLTTSLSLAMVKYRKWRIKNAITNLKHLISQSIDQSELLTAHELMCKYLTELSYYPTSKAAQECFTLLRDLVNTLHRRISELKNSEGELNRFVEFGEKTCASTS